MIYILFLNSLLPNVRHLVYNYNSLPYPQLRMVMFLLAHNHYNSTCYTHWNLIKRLKLHFVDSKRKYWRKDKKWRFEVTTRDPITLCKYHCRQTSYFSRKGWGLISTNVSINSKTGKIANLNELRCFHSLRIGYFSQDQCGMIFCHKWSFITRIGQQYTLSMP